MLTLNVLSTYITVILLQVSSSIPTHSQNVLQVFFRLDPFDAKLCQLEARSRQHESPFRVHPTQAGNLDQTVAEQQDQEEQTPRVASSDRENFQFGAEFLNI